ncbi:MAG: hypothetical protein FWF15_10305, partial [Oscillospiraceae bacterium]|nr:hypothetical protein [Oscillospiraceae bacterium]
MRKLLLIIMLLSLIFSACANNDAEPDNGKPYLAETDDAVIGETTTEENRILPNLSADTNFNGYTFNVLIRDTGDEWTPRDVFAEKENGDLINDAVYRRNRVIEEKYNFKIEQKVVFEYIGNPITKAVASGDNEFDIAYPFLCDVPDLAQKGYFVDLLRVPNLDLTRLWWDAKATAALSVGGKLYFTAGDLMLMNFDACPGILFNKTLLDDNNLQNPYDLVDKNEWTINKLYEMSRAAP